MSTCKDCAPTDGNLLQREMALGFLFSTAGDVCERGQPVVRSSFKTSTTILAGSVDPGATVDAQNVHFWLFFWQVFGCYLHVLVGNRRGILAE
jgi:hypothetical protein